MKLTEQKLREIIREEINGVLYESSDSMPSKQDTITNAVRILRPLLGFPISETLYDYAKSKGITKIPFFWSGENKGNGGDQSKLDANELKILTKKYIQIIPSEIESVSKLLSADLDYAKQRSSIVRLIDEKDSDAVKKLLLNEIKKEGLDGLLSMKGRQSFALRFITKTIKQYYVEEFKDYV